MNWLTTGIFWTTLLLAPLPPLPVPPVPLAFVPLDTLPPDPLLIEELVVAFVFVRPNDDGELMLLVVIAELLLTALVTLDAAFDDDLNKKIKLTIIKCFLLQDNDKTRKTKNLSQKNKHFTHPS